MALAVAGVATGERSTAGLRAGGPGGPGGLAVARWVAHAAAVVDSTGEEQATGPATGDCLLGAEHTGHGDVAVAGAGPGNEGRAWRAGDVVRVAVVGRGPVAAGGLPGAGVGAHGELCAAAYRGRHHGAAASTHQVHAGRLQACRAGPRVAPGVARVQAAGQGPATLPGAHVGRLDGPQIYRGGRAEGPVADIAGPLPLTPEGRLLVGAAPGTTHVAAAAEPGHAPVVAHRAVPGLGQPARHRVLRPATPACQVHHPVARGTRALVAPPVAPVHAARQQPATHAAARGYRVRAPGPRPRP